MKLPSVNLKFGELPGGVVERFLLEKVAFGNVSTAYLKGESRTVTVCVAVVTLVVVETDRVVN